MRRFIRLDDTSGNTLMVDVSHIIAFSVESVKVTIVLDTGETLTQTNYNQLEVDVAINIWIRS